MYDSSRGWDSYLETSGTRTVSSETYHNDKTVTLTRAELRQITKEAALEAVGEMLTKLGIQHEQPLEMQRDFQFIRDWRLSSESVKVKAFIAAVTILISGLAGAAWMGLRALLMKD